MNGQNVSSVYYSTEDNLSSLNNITKQFSQSDGTTTVSFVVYCFLTHTCPDTLLSSPIDFIFLYFVTTTACKLCEETFSNLYNIKIKGIVFIILLCLMAVI